MLIREIYMFTHIPGLNSVTNALALTEMLNAPSSIADPKLAQHLIRLAILSKFFYRDLKFINIFFCINLEK